MIKPLYIDTILVDIFLDGVFQFTVNKFTHIDLRTQICKQSLEGYSIKVNPTFWDLFDEEDNIEDFEIKIDSGGGVDKWFPEYYINEDYNSVRVFSEMLSATIALRNAQQENKEN